VSRLGGMLGFDADEMSRLLAAYGGWEGQPPARIAASTADTGRVGQSAGCRRSLGDHPSGV